MKRLFETKLKELRDITHIQGHRGNWNSSDHNCGLYNGLEFALSIMEEREPKYKAIKKNKTGAQAA
jgi:hypothetical protein